MPDAVYKNVNFIFKSRGINARNVTDTLPEGVYLNLQNCEELAENAMSCRLGTIAINQEAGVWQLLEAPVHSLAKLSGLGGLAWRYAGGGTLLYRIQWGILGTYFEIASGLSGQPWQAAFFTPTDFTSTPYIFFADANGMLKDNGNLVPPQQMGIFQPQFPVQAQVWTTNFTQLEPAGGETYATTGITGFASGQTVAPNTTMTSAVTATGRNTVSVAGTNNIQVNQWLYVGLGGAHQESVFVISVTPTSFTAYFSFTHTVGEAVIGVGIAGEVAAASTTGTVTATYAAKIGPSIGWVQQADYIGLQLFVDQPQNVQQIVLKFDCGDGSFSDYFYKVIGQGALQNLLDTTASTTAQSAATDAIITESLGAYGNAPGAIAELNVGTNVTTPLNIQLSDFASAGRADFNDQTYNWQNVGKYQIEVLTNSGGAVNFKLYSMQMFGGFGPDTFAGVAYDYLVTFYNAADGTESNPCMQMTNQDPPNDTNWVYPRRSPVQLTIDLNTYSGVGILDIDPQITHIRIYRRGGTLGDNWRRVDQVAVAGGGTIQYLDIASDAGIQDSDIVSFTNDVPVTSSLPVPVNTNLTANVTPPAVGGIVNVPVGNMANIFVGQQVTIGTFGALVNNVETVIVTGIRAGFFIAFVQNQHLNSEPVTATAVYGQPVTIMTQAFGQMWFAGDPNNPHYLYWSNGNNPQGLSSASWVPVGSPDDPITAIVQLKGNLYVSTGKYWWAVSPGAQTGQQPTVYPTVAKHGCVATGGYAVTEQGIYYQAIDGIRFFAGGASEYLTQEQEFIWQGVGSSPIVEADQTKFSQTRMAYWNNMIFVSYVGLDENYHRMIYHTIYKRWRNDDIEATSILLEVDTNTLVCGGPAGGVRLDRQNQPFDSGLGAGNAVTQQAIGIVLQTPFDDQGMPSITKSYQELTLDINTQGQTLSVFLIFEDGRFVFQVGTVQTNVRQKVNYNLNNSLGFEYYKVSLQLSGSVLAFPYIYQCSLKSLPLAKTRKSFDSFWLNLGTDESKVIKQAYFEYTSTADSFFSVYYDGSQAPLFQFTLPNSNGIRQSVRVRLPAVSCRIIRFVGICANDFQVWESSKIDMKPLCSGKGYQTVEFVPNS